MTTFHYYLTNLLPHVVGFAAVFFMIGLTFGWLTWGNGGLEAYRIEAENERIRDEIHEYSLAE